MNLALPMWVFSQPMPPIQHVDKEYDPVFLGPVRAIPAKYTNWDKFQISGPITIKQLSQHFNKTYKISLSIITLGKVCIFNKYDPRSKENYEKIIEDVFKDLAKQDFPHYKTYVAIEANAQDQQGVDCSIPTIKYKLGKK